MDQAHKQPDNHPDGQRIHTLELVVSEMDAQIHHLQAIVQVMARDAQDPQDPTADSPAPGAPNTMRDEVWACENCAARLGIYNPKTDQLRVRYKDFVAYVQPGVGGSIMVPCRRCGEQNTLSDTRSSRQLGRVG